MNKQIKELYTQVCTEQKLPFTVEHNSAVMLDAFANKFAELIVRECINEIAYIGKANEVFGDRTDRGGLNHILWTTETAIEKIKQHFGVEP